MIIKIGDNVSVNQRGSILPREGVITGISIGLTTSDPAGELGINLKEYDTEMNYLGSIDYKTDSGENYWAYFSQIEEELDEFGQPIEDHQQMPAEEGWSI